MVRNATIEIDMNSSKNIFAEPNDPFIVGVYFHKIQDSQLASGLVIRQSKNQKLDVTKRKQVQLPGFVKESTSINQTSFAAIIENVSSVAEGASSLSLFYVNLLSQEVPQKIDFLPDPTMKMIYTEGWF